MTEHPLTDEFLTQFGILDNQCVEGERVFFDDDMRAAYDKGRDDQLKDDMKWLKKNLGEWLAYEDLWDMQTKIGIGMFINDLKRAMRPEQEINYGT